MYMVNYDAHAYQYSFLATVPSLLVRHVIAMFVSRRTACNKASQP